MDFWVFDPACFLTVLSWAVMMDGGGGTSKVTCVVYGPTFTRSKKKHRPLNLSAS
jgi:hypothetical protein